jgi:hypothetical protein
MDDREYPDNVERDHMIGSETQEPGPGRDARLTNPDPDPAEMSAENPTAPVAMSDNDPERTRLGTQEVPVDPDDRGMIGSETQEPGPGRDARLTNPDPAEADAEHSTTTVAMSKNDPERTRLGAQERE